jgi:hypothetical protein
MIRSQVLVTEYTPTFVRLAITGGRLSSRTADPRPYVDGQVTFGVAGPAVLIGDDPFHFASAGGADAWVVTPVTPDTRSKVRGGQVAAADFDGTGTSYSEQALTSVGPGQGPC